MSWVSVHALSPEDREVCDWGGIACTRHFICADCGLLTHLSGWLDEDDKSADLSAADVAVYGDPPRCAGCRTSARA